MMRQYNEIKAQVADCIVFFRLGDFYEMFGADALEASEILGITLTARNKGDKAIPMCGVPYHAAAGYIAKLTRTGKKVAICEQVSDPSLPGIVKREIVRVVTPGTTLDENVLEDRKANYLLAVHPSLEPTGGDNFGLALVEISTGEFTVLAAKDLADLGTVCRKYQPREIIFPHDLPDGKGLELLKKYYPEAFYFAEDAAADGEDQLDEHFGTLEVGGKYLSGAEKAAAALALNYLNKTQKTTLSGSALVHMKDLSAPGNRLMKLDESTIRNLELTENLRDKKTEGSLLSVLDKTITSAGARMLKRIIVEPLSELEAIEKRLETIDLLMEKQNLLLDLRLALKGVLDLERMIGRLSLASGNARDMRGVAASLAALEELSSLLDGNCPELSEKNPYRLRLLPELRTELEKSLVDEPPLSIRDGGMIRDGYDPELDQLRGLSREGKSFIQALQAREIARTGINSLKVRYNRVFGYYIEISNANLSQVPDDYTRKQTLANAERFSTPELKQYEEKVLTAEEQILAIESRLFEKLRGRILEKAAEIKEGAAAAAYLDVMVSLALTGWENHYTRPRLGDGYDLRIVGGRHPVIEKLNPQDKFVPNDSFLTDERRLTLITGPNMGGKSTYLRQTALIVLMAHLGMYVPATSAEIPLVDRIFTRVGASDNLVKGQSTFWLEMEETALILRQATSKSLIVLDEIGRGTSTFDGVSIAWGVMEYLHDKIGAKTLFASHYHELIALADTLPRAANLSVRVEERPEGVVFLYLVGEGGVDRSYGIEVARRAGLPPEVIGRAREILADLEKENIGSGQQSFAFGGQPGNMTGDRPGAGDYAGQYFQQHPETAPQASNSTMEQQRNHAGLQKLRELEIERLTPLEALNKLEEIKKIIERDG